jgi:sugar phosphate isomerase/epimerase
LNSFDRRHFVKSSFSAGLGIAAVHSPLSTVLNAYPFPDANTISLATWSLVRSFRAGIWKLTDVARICREDFGLDGIEYVTSFFEVPVESYLRELNQVAADNGIKNVLIMVDNEGDMVAKDRKVRMQAAVNHRKWVDIAAFLGCHAIRCNARGGGDTPEADPQALDRAAESFTALIEYAGESRINVLIENHGGLSSDPNWLPELMKKVNSPHFGILPDYGNYHPTAETDVYESVRLAMPYAKGVSVKAAWAPDGSHPQYDLERLLQISLGAGYSGFWGIESSLRRPRGSEPTSPSDIKADEWQAVRWTKTAIEKVVAIS